MTKHDSKTADELIVENAPEGATHVDNNGFYLKASTSGYLDFDNDGRDWDYDYADHCHTRSLADIKELVELRKKNAELEKMLIKLVDDDCNEWYRLEILNLLNGVDNL